MLFHLSTNESQSGAQARRLLEAVIRTFRAGEWHAQQYELAAMRTGDRVSRKRFLLLRTCS